MGHSRGMVEWAGRQNPRVDLHEVRRIALVVVRHILAVVEERRTVLVVGEHRTGLGVVLRIVLADLAEALHTGLGEVAGTGRVAVLHSRVVEEVRRIDLGEAGRHIDLEGVRHTVLEVVLHSPVGADNRLVGEGTGFAALVEVADSLGVEVVRIPGAGLGPHTAAGSHLVGCNTT